MHVLLFQFALRLWAPVRPENCRQHWHSLSGGSASEDVSRGVRHIQGAGISSPQLLGSRGCGAGEIFSWMKVVDEGTEPGEGVLMMMMMCGRGGNGGCSEELVWT